MVASKRESGTASTPLGLPAVVLMIFYFLVICFTASSVIAPPPFKTLMKSAGIGEHLDEEAGKTLRLEIVNMGFMISVVGGLIIGPINDFAGPKFTAVLGQVLTALGYSLMFFTATDATTLHYIASTCLGFAFSAIFVSHTSVAALFPNQSTTVLAVIGSGPDIGLIVPNVLGRLSSSLGASSVVFGYIMVVCGIGVLDSFLVPVRPFETPTSAVDDSSSSAELANVAAVKAPAQPLAHLPLIKQIFHPVNITLTLFTGFNMFRKCLFAQKATDIFEDVGRYTGTPIDEVASYSALFSDTLCLAVVPAMLMGVFTNQFGIVKGIHLENTWGTLLFICCSIASMKLQYLSIVFFNLMSSYVIGTVFASVSTYFGWKTFGTLQGLQLAFAGVMTHLFVYWNRYVVSAYPSILSSNKILLAVSVFAYGVPFYLGAFERSAQREAAKQDSEKKSLIAHRPDGYTTYV